MGSILCPENQSAVHRPADENSFASTELLLCAKGAKPPSTELPMNPKKVTFPHIFPRLFLLFPCWGQFPSHYYTAINVLSHLSQNGLCGALRNLDGALNRFRLPQ